MLFDCLCEELNASFNSDLSQPFIKDPDRVELHFLFNSLQAFLCQINIKYTLICQNAVCYFTSTWVSNHSCISSRVLAIEINLIFRLFMKYSVTRIFCTLYNAKQFLNFVYRLSHHVISERVFALTSLLTTKLSLLFDQ